MVTAAGGSRDVEPHGAAAVRGNLLLDRHAVAEPRVRDQARMLVLFQCSTRTSQALLCPSLPSTVGQELDANRSQPRARALAGILAIDLAELLVQVAREALSLFVVRQISMLHKQAVVG